MDGQRLPFVDGVLILYDVTNPASIAKLPESLGESWMSYFSTLISCDGIAVSPVPFANHGLEQIRRFRKGCAPNTSSLVQM